MFAWFPTWIGLASSGELIDYERSLQEQVATPTIATVNYTHKTSAQTPGRDSRTNARPNTFGPRNLRSSNTRPHFHNNRSYLFCQYCSIAGHETKECRKLARFLKENNITIAQTSQPSPTINHSVAAPASTTPPWMFDSGASHHIASDRYSLHTLSDYGGTEEIVLGNGTTLPISHSGQSSISTQSRSLQLQNVLFVP